MFTDDVVTILEQAGVGAGGTTILVGSKAVLPASLQASDTPFVTIMATGGASPEGTHNLTVVPAYVRPAAQVVARAKRASAAESMAQAAYQAIYPIRNQFINGVWWRQVTMKQEPFDMGEDANGRPRWAFNFECVKRLNAETSGVGFAAPAPVPYVAPSIYELIEDLGGNRNDFVLASVSDAYPAGATFDKLVPGSWPVVLNATRLYAGTFYFECSARVSVVGARVKVGLFDLVNAPNTVIAGSEMTFTTSELKGERKRSAAFVIPPVDTTFGVKLTVNSTTIDGAAWGCRIVRA